LAADRVGAVLVIEMSSESQSTPMIAYESPVRGMDRLDIKRDERGVCVDLGPVPDCAFALAMLVPGGLLTVFVALILFGVPGVRTAVPGLKWAAGAAFLIIILTFFISMARNRRVPRVVVVRDGVLSYSNPITAGKLQVVSASRARVIRLHRSRLFPWVSRIEAGEAASVWADESKRPETIVLGATSEPLAEVAAVLTEELGRGSAGGGIADGNAFSSEGSGGSFTL
jgi:hypothetical protein